MEIGNAVMIGCNEYTIVEIYSRTLLVIQDIYEPEHRIVVTPADIKPKS
jgi:hypothetical protein